MISRLKKMFPVIQSKELRPTTTFYVFKPREHFVVDTPSIITGSETEAYEHLQSVLENLWSRSPKCETAKDAARSINERSGCYGNTSIGRNHIHHSDVRSRWVAHIICTRVGKYYVFINPSINNFLARRK